MDLFKKLHSIYNGAGVKRWHTHHTIQMETLAAHHAMTAQLALALDMPKEVIYYCLTHDMGEIVAGDIPSTTKAALGSNLKDALEEYEMSVNPFRDYRIEETENKSNYNMFLWCDLFSRVLFILKEESLGNYGLSQIKYNTLSRLKIIVNAIDDVTMMQKLNRIIFVVESLEK